MSQPFDLVFRECTLIDGTGAPGRLATVAVAGERIAAVDPPAEQVRRARQVVEAQGLFCTPGFIDLHSHSDFACLLHPQAESKVLAGVTTEIDGNCGCSAVPLRGEVRARRQEEYHRDGLVLDWTDLDSYAARVEGQGSSINRGLLAGHGNIRGVVMGYAARPASGEELRAMCRELEAVLAAGAYGLSSGLLYPPGCFADGQEIAVLARVVAAHGGFYASHIRSEGDHLEEAVEEFLQAAGAAGVRANLSHVKTGGRRNWHKIAWLRQRLFRARQEGLDLGADRYPYTASHTSLDAFLLPAWAFEGGTAAEIGRLTDPDTRQRLRTEVLAHLDEGYWNRLVISQAASSECSHLEGKSLAQIAQESGQDPLEAAFDLIVADHAQVTAIHFSMSEDNLREILSWPFVAIGSDASLKAPPGPGLPSQAGRPHPRCFATATRVLAHYTRDLGLLTWEQAVHKLTGLPSRMAGLRCRGTVAPGHFADLCLFRPGDLQERATFDDPRQLSAGMSWVLVNGVPVVRDGRHTGARPGRVLRGPAA